MDCTERGFVDLDDVDVGVDEDTDAATAERPSVRTGRSVDRVAAVPSRVKRVAPAAMTGAAAGSAAAAGGVALRKHPKATIGLALLGAAIMAAPADQRRAVIKAVAIAGAVVVVLVVLLLAVVVLLGVYGPQPAPPPTPPPLPPAPCELVLCT